MKTYNCPSCGATITFQSSVTVSCVCPYCRSLVVRNDVNVEAIGKMAELPDDSSPFQIGTTGVFQKIHFTLIGRMKIGWSDGNWNEWFMMTDTGQKGWLAEAQGALAINFEVDDAKLFTNQKSVASIVDMPSLGNAIAVGDVWYTVADIKEAECIGSEGELPLGAPAGRKCMSYDLIGRNGAFASIEFADSKPRVYTGEYVEFNNLHFGNLRELPGWQVQRPAIAVTSSKKKKTDGPW